MHQDPLLCNWNGIGRVKAWRTEGSTYTGLFPFITILRNWTMSKLISCLWYVLERRGTREEGPQWGTLILSKPTGWLCLEPSVLGVWRVHWASQIRNSWDNRIKGPSQSWIPISMPCTYMLSVLSTHLSPLLVCSFLISQICSAIAIPGVLPYCLWWSKGQYSKMAISQI